MSHKQKHGQEPVLHFPLGKSIPRSRASPVILVGASSERGRARHWNAGQALHEFIYCSARPWED